MNGATAKHCNFVVIHTSTVTLYLNRSRCPRLVCGEISTVDWLRVCTDSLGRFYSISVHCVLDPLCERI